MKVLIIHNDYKLAGGEMIAVNNLVTLLRERNHEVFLYTRKNEEINNYGFQKKVSFFPNTIYSRQTYQEIVKLVREYHPDLAHVHNVFPLISPSVYSALRDKGIPIIQTVHNFRFLCPNGLFFTGGEICERCKRGQTYNAINRKCYKDSYTLSTLYALNLSIHRSRGTFEHIDRFIAQTEFSKMKLIEGGIATDERIAILGNFIPDPLPEPGSIEMREPYIVFFGKIGQGKRLGNPASGD